ncbi:MAG: response regulator transcription factor [Gammaproteobacteria bacterium]|nr:response regulator transcription factor [Gammaproteobacteria bacterium]MDH5731306.1 response regulator transcription factor [Gammaproteobacteria bacterium]
MNDQPTTEKLLRVLLIDDHSLFRVGLEGLLERRGIEIVASVASGSEGIDLVHNLQPDIVLLDVRMPDMNGLEILETLRKQGCKIPVIMVTTSRDDKDIAKALRCGATGYLLKDMEPDELVQALHAIMRGETVVAPELATTLARVVQGKNPQDTEDKLESLTPREREILQHIAEGGSNKVIGRALGITDGTVKLHVKSILRKLDVHSRVEAAVIAVEHGLGSQNRNN